METTYTQVIDKKTGEIKYVPNTPPPPPESKGGGTGSDTSEEQAEVKERIGALDLSNDPLLADTMNNLLNNAKRLRYDRRLESGKLDGRRLSAYRTSDRLFKRKAIKNRNYQFTFLMDTSGSMMGQLEENKPIKLSMQAVSRIVKALEEVKVKSSVFAMNCVFEQIKDFDTPFDDSTFANKITANMAGNYEDSDSGRSVNNWAGTAEWVAYEQTVKYLKTNTKPPTTNVVIILSDGEPGAGTVKTKVVIDGKTTMVDTNEKKNSTDSLAHFWDRQTAVKAFGIGIKRKAKQVPVNKVVSDVTTLPDVLSKLLTELML
jgi:nitric oxide reductase activation protein